LPLSFALPHLLIGSSVKTQITLGILVLVLVILLAACVSDPSDAKVSEKFDAFRAKAFRLQAGSCPAAESDWHRLGTEAEDTENDFFATSANSERMDALNRIEKPLN
jgi:hypothetical protein